MAAVDVLEPLGLAELQAPVVAMGQGAWVLHVPKTELAAEVEAEPKPVVERPTAAAIPKVPAELLL